METMVKAQYLCMLVRGEALHQFDFLSADTESANPLTVEDIIIGLSLYISLLISYWRKIAQCAAEWTILSD